MWLSVLIKAPILHSMLSKAELFSGATNFISLKTLCTPLTQNPGLQSLRSPFLPDHLKYLWLDLAAPVKPSTHTDILVQTPCLELHTVLGAGNSGEHNCIIRLTHNQPFHFRKKKTRRKLFCSPKCTQQTDDKPVVTGFWVPLSWHSVTRNCDTFHCGSAVPTKPLTQESAEQTWLTKEEANLSHHYLQNFSDSTKSHWQNSSCRISVKETVQVWGRVEILHSLLCHKEHFCFPNRNPKIWHRRSFSSVGNNLLEQAVRITTDNLSSWTTDVKFAFHHEIMNYFMCLAWEKPKDSQRLWRWHIHSCLKPNAYLPKYGHYNPASRSHFPSVRADPETTDKPRAFLSVHTHQSLNVSRVLLNLLANKRLFWDLLWNIWAILFIANNAVKTEAAISVICFFLVKECLSKPSIRGNNKEAFTPMKKNLPLLYLLLNHSRAVIMTGHQEVRN